MKFFEIFRYAFEGILQAIYGSDRPALKCSTDLCVQSPRRILKQLNMPSVSFCTINLALIGWILFLHISIYSVLRWKLRLAAKR